MLTVRLDIAVTRGSQFDYRSGLYVIILSDATVSTAKKYGDVHYDEVVDLREKLHAAIKLDLGATY